MAQTEPRRARTPTWGSPAGAGPARLEVPAVCSGEFRACRVLWSVLRSARVRSGVCEAFSTCTARPEKDARGAGMSKPRTYKRRKLGMPEILCCSEVSISVFHEASHSERS